MNAPGIPSYIDSKTFSWDKTASDMNGEFLIVPFSDSEQESISELIRTTMTQYAEAGSVIASTLRRIKNLAGVYHQPGAQYFVARDMSQDGLCVGGAGIGPLHGLPVSEGVGEVRDIVVREEYRSRGIGTKLLKRCLEEAHKMSYKRIYLESTPDMKIAQKLFQRFGFRPVTQNSENELPSDDQNMPCYYVIEDLSKVREIEADSK